MTREQIDAVLADFRAWLEEVVGGESGVGGQAFEAGETPAVDLYTLVAQFTALRHEVNLQTRAVRAQQEQNAATLERLTDALQALERRPAGGADAGGEPVRPLLQTLVELHDALGVGAREARRLQEAVLPVLEESTRAEAEPTPRPTGLAGWLARRHWDAQAAGHAEHARRLAGAAGQAHRLVDSLVTGYAMSLRRLERALDQHGLQPITAVGRPFDPEQMEAVEAVADSGRPAGEVVQELRRGYLWQGRVFRYALVRVAK